MPTRRQRQTPTVEQYRREAIALRRDAATVRAALAHATDDTVDQLARVLADDTRVTATAGAMARTRIENGFTTKLRALFEGGQHAHG